jgi:hypothetical protein
MNFDQETARKQPTFDLGLKKALGDERKAALLAIEWRKL